MAITQMAPYLPKSLLVRMDEARERTDRVFDLLPPTSLYERPIPERHRLIFYLGHLEAFDWNLFAPPLGLESDSPELDKLFAFGIDPVDGGLPTDVPSDWPTIGHVQRYNRRVRTRLDDALRCAARSQSDQYINSGKLLNVAIEHRLMHAETLAYLLHALAVDKKIAHVAIAADSRTAPQARQVDIFPGIVTLGQSRDIGGFGWDNEFEIERVDVPNFAIDAFPVTNQEYLKFVRAGGYQNQSYWTPEDWAWRKRENVEHSHFWRPRAGSTSDAPQTEWDYRGMFGTIPLPLSWPVFVSHAEAAAFARWAGKRLPSEAEWHLAAYGEHNGSERAYPWGDEHPSPTRGNFHHQSWEPSAVDAHPAGASAFGVFDLLGNGWEWTSTPFAPFRGFEPFPFYQGYSANFFDGKHFVMKGGSHRTDACMLRRSYRNWFQPHYPYIYATFRCVAE
ncbi:MAG TPA: SUMF1/EgtB/PvdO family nonheme iron enzyme [Candidatus Acidoferrales bacterium]|nr:SUMF1/EgtB/PvdO family nonheme iron enzyme [Candidatus Acidoferrales bacterium]